MSSVQNDLVAAVPVVWKEDPRLSRVEAPKTKPAFLQEIRLMQALAILCVVFAHSVIPGQRFTGAFELFDRFIRTATVPLFICVSGYLYHYAKSGNKPAGAFLRERLLRLLWPYLALSTVAFLIKANLGSLASRVLHFTLADYLHQLLYPWDNAIIFFWYLPTLMLICVASVYLDKWLIKKHPATLLPLLLVLACVAAVIGINQIAYPIRFLNISGALSYLVYFWIGYAVSKYDREFSRVFRSGLLCAGFLLICMIWTIRYSNPDHFLALCEASVAVVALLMFVKQISRWREWPMLSQIGDNSYQIYLLSWFFQTLPVVAFSYLVSRNQYVCAALSLALGISGPIAVTSVVRKRLPAVRSVLGLR